MSEQVIQIRQCISDVFGVPLEDVRLDASPQTLEAWDSLGHLNLVLALEQSFGAEFSPEEVASMVSIPAIQETLVRKGLPG